MQKILYVEDDLSLIDGLQYTLEASGSWWFGDCVQSCGSSALYGLVICLSLALAG